MVALTVAPQAAAREMRFLRNAVVKVGIDLDEGGVITFVSRGSAGAPNVINDHDLGRQVQPSYYSGPEGFGGEPCANFSAVWNPIGAGDCYGRASTVLASWNNGQTMYVKSRPLHWAFDNVPCNCIFEQWITLGGRAVLVQSRLTNRRKNHTLYPPRSQELPAVYTIGRLAKLITYSGAHPWTGRALRTVKARLPRPATFTATENWAAYVDRNGFGLGVFALTITTFLGGFHGRRGVGESLDDNTGYLAPTREELLDWNIVYDYEYALVLGSVGQIRSYATAHRPPAPDWQFAESREGFRYVNATDAGFPIRGVLRVRLDRRDPQVWSPPTFWRAEDVPAVKVRMALHGTSAREASLYWSVHGGGFARKQQVRFRVVADGAFHTYRVPLAGANGYSGGITRLRLDLIERGASQGAYAEIDSIVAAP